MHFIQLTFSGGAKFLANLDNATIIVPYDEDNLSSGSRIIFVDGKERIVEEPIDKIMGTFTSDTVTR